MEGKESSFLSQNTCEPTPASRVDRVEGHILPLHGGVI